jgi:hypothetical protein
VTPRRTHPKRRLKPQETADAPVARDIVVGAPPGWQVRAIQKATKEYRCPGCNQEIRPGTAHVVAWRENDEEGRRHWHTPCWRRFAKR